MRGLVRWFIDNSVAANLLMLLLLLGGAASIALSLRSEQFPKIPADTISISVLYPGATPTEVEESICVKIEEAVQEVDDVKRIVSVASENIGSVRVEVMDGVDPRDVLDEIKTEVDQIITFPADAEEPEIELIEVDERAISIAVLGDLDERTLRVIADEIREEVLRLDGITKAEIEDGRPYEISIEIQEAELRRHGLTFDDVANAVRGYSLNLPAGSVKTRAGEILFRSSAQAYDEDEFLEIPVVTRPDGSRILVEDVATVEVGFEDIELHARIDGKRALICQVYRVADQDTSDVAAAIQEYVESKRQQLPEAVQLVVWQDESVDLAARLELLADNGRIGLLLVVIVLALFLRARLAFWVAAGLTTALFGTLWVMPMLGMTLNFLTSFGLLVVLGILVDDAIVVSENIDAHRQKGLDPRTAAEVGTFQVMVPVCLAIATTAIAFSPMLQLPGRTGTFAANIAVTVIIAIGFSLIESLFILPAHLAHEAGDPADQRGWLGSVRRGLAVITGPFAKVGRRVQDRCAGGLDWLIEHTYRPTLERALRYRYLTLAIGVVFLCATVGLIAGKHIKYNFFPKIEGNRVLGTVSFLPGAAVEETERAVALMEARVREVLDDFEREAGQEIVRHVRTSIGGQRGLVNSGPPAQSGGSSGGSSHLGEVHVELIPSEDREVTASEIARRWRERLGDELADATDLNFTADQINAGAGINVELSSPNFDDLTHAAEDLKAVIRSLPGTYNVTDDDRPGKEELSLAVLPAGEALGLTQRDVARQVRQGFYGDEAQRVQLGKDDVKVFVRYTDAERRSLHSLDHMRVRLADGSEIPFQDVATYSVERGSANIQRIDRRRTIVVTGEVDRSVANATELNARLEEAALPELARKYGGLRYRLGGEQSDQRESGTSMLQGMLLALFMMYALLAVVFRSYSQPILVVSAIPFGFGGAIWAHYLLGMDLTFMSVIGLLALMGVVVNDSLVLIDFVNRYRREERSSTALGAIRLAGPRRFRAILLTSLTTFAGLTPILLERSVQAAFIIPMAVSIAFGVAFATVVILVLVPAGYLVLEDVLNFLGLTSPAEPEPTDGTTGPEPTPAPRVGPPLPAPDA